MTSKPTIKRNGQTFEVCKYFFRQVQKGITVRYIETTSAYGLRLVEQAREEGKL